MSQNPQVPFLFTLSSGSLTITNARAITVYTSGGTTNIVNSLSQTLVLADTLTYEVTADTGNTLSTVVISPNSGATCFVSMLGGNGVVTP
jgi:hypothetical protein